MGSMSGSKKKKKKSVRLHTSQKVQMTDLISDVRGKMETIRVNMVIYFYYLKTKKLALAK